MDLDFEEKDEGRLFTRNDAIIEKFGSETFLKTLWTSYGLCDISHVMTFGAKSFVTCGINDGYNSLCKGNLSVKKTNI